MGKVNHTILEADHEKILTMWHEGLGASAIGLRLAYGHSSVRKFLESRGLKRTSTEGIRAHVKALGGCGFKTPKK